MAEGNVTDPFGVDPGARNGLAHHGGGKVDRRGVLECAAKRTDGGTNPG